MYTWFSGSVLYKIECHDLRMRCSTGWIVMTFKDKVFYWIDCHDLKDDMF